MAGQDEDGAGRGAAPLEGVRQPSGKDMPALGTVLGGRFQLEAQLGKGGSGVVFRALDRVMGEPVAVKLLFPERADDEGWIRRLVREVKVARTIFHPNVRRIFEIGKVDGYWLITMELAAGSLGERMRGLPHADEPLRRPLPPWLERRDDARAVVDGLAAIHAAGVIHRDVTPNNVLRMVDGRLVLSDFGLALLDGETTALIAGTPNYVAPEVLSGERTDQRSDVWQLGLVLHEIVFERRPRWTTADAQRELLPPARIDDPATPVEEVMRILSACLQVDPRRRATNAMAVAQAFEGATVEAFGDRRRARRRRAFGVALGALAVGVVVAVRVAPAWRAPAPPGATTSTPAALPAPAAPVPTRGAAAAARIHVHVHLASVPSHARVVDVASSELWGVTPLDAERAATAGVVTLRFDKPRFETTVITLAGDRDVVATVELRPRRAAAAPGASEAPPTPATPDEPGKI